MKKPLIIGLTGGIGSGKTTLARYMASKGVPVYIADEEARKLMESETMLEQLRAQFDADLFDPHTGRLDRRKMADYAFQNPEALSRLNAIVHPAVKAHFSQWVMQHQQHPFVVKEAAILFESGSYRECDKVITIVAPQAVRVQRVMNRDDVNEADVKNRMKNQWTQEKKMEKSDFVVNNENLSDAKREIDDLIQKLSNIQKLQLLLIFG